MPKKRSLSPAIEPARFVSALEWPTLALMVGVFAAYALLTLNHARLPGWLLFVGGGLVLALYSSLQHEVIHHHPTRSRCVNEALVWLPLSLWLPYAVYRETHLRHHRNENLTDPLLDPESYYLPAAAWQSLSRWQQCGYRLLNTMAGRLLAGAVFIPLHFLWQAVRQLLQGDDTRRQVRLWGWHLLGVAVVVYWVTGVCRMPFWAYVGLFVYPGTMLSLLRSFIEHRAVPVPAERSAIVESNAFFCLLFLNNNLHAVHHALPALPWYRIPAYWRANREAVLARNGQYYFRGYAEVARHFGLRVRESPRYPL
ncbi:MAG: fatty acid desaturase [Thiothrix sp.]|nr:fatty acid desaturase [Thiothrix sp.]HPQ96438.1 fatty acid desaturase [Thiolinea sp.]